MRVTARGWGMLVAGALLACAAAALQSLALARLAAVALAVPVVALVWALLVRAFAARRGLQRSVQPHAWQVDQPGTVDLVPTGATLPPWSSLRERVPASLRRRSHGPFGYAVLPSARGRHHLGPAVLLRSDPLHIATWRTSIGSRTEVIVWPRTEPISEDVLAHALEATAPVPHGAPQRTLEDLTIREYRRGDDLRRIHWRSSARHSELMVRHDEPTTTKVLDLLLVLSDHADEVTEWAVTAAASMATALLDAGYAIRVVTVVDGALSTAPARSTADALDVLALASPAHDLAPEVVRTVQRSTSAGVVAVLDRPDAPLGDVMVAAGGLELSTALVVAGEATVVDALEHAGWQVATSDGTGSVAEAWRTWESVR